MTTNLQKDASVIPINVSTPPAIAVIRDPTLACIKPATGPKKDMLLIRPIFLFICLYMFDELLITFRGDSILFVWLSVV